MLKNKKISKEFLVEIVDFIFQIIFLIEVHGIKYHKLKMEESPVFHIWKCFEAYAHVPNKNDQSWMIRLKNIFSYVINWALKATSCRHVITSRNVKFNEEAWDGGT